MHVVILVAVLLRGVGAGLRAGQFEHWGETGEAKGWRRTVAVLVWRLGDTVMMVAMLLLGLGWRIISVDL